MKGQAAVTFVETTSAAAEADRETGSIVALSPWAEVELEKRHIAFTRTSDYLSRRDREDLGRQTFGLTDRLVQLLDDALVAEAPGLVSTKFRPAFASYFWLKVAVDTVMLRVAELDAVMAALQPQTVRYHPMPTVPIEVPALRYTDEPIYSQLIPAVAAKFGARVEELASELWPFGSKLQGTFSRRLTSMVERIGEVAATRPSRRPRPGGVVLGLDTCLAKELVSRSPHRLLIWQPGAARYLDLGGLPVLRRAPKARHGSLEVAGELAWNRLLRGSDLERLLSCASVSGLPLLRDRLHRLLTVDATALYRIYEAAVELVRRQSVDVVLSRTFAEADRRAVAQAARTEGARVVAYDHGAMGYFNFPMDRYLDSAVADVRLVWGDGVKRQVEHRYPEGARPAAVGGAVLDPFLGVTERTRVARRRRWCRQLGLDPSRIVVLYCVSSLSGNSQYLSHRIGTDGEYAAHARAILRAIKARPEIQLVLKLHPTSEPPGTPLGDFVTTEGITNCVVVRTPGLESMLDVADIHLNDSPTTTLLLMLTTEKPVLVMDNGAMEIEPDALAPLRKRVVLTDSPQELISALDAHVAGESWANVKDTEFLRLYGTYVGDGQSSHRALEALSSELIRRPR